MTIPVEVRQLAGGLLVAIAVVVLIAAVANRVLHDPLAPPPPWVEWRQLGSAGAPSVWRLHDRHAGITCYVARRGIACVPDVELGAR